MTLKTTALTAFVLLTPFLLYAQDAPRLPKTAVDDNSKYTNVGNIGITVTNFGVVGHGFRLWPQQPSFQYPKASGIEHLFAGGLWIGANIPAGPTAGIHVTTGAVDISALRTGVAAGFEFTDDSSSHVTERSTLPDSRFYNPVAISHQDFLADFTDRNTTTLNGEIIPQHIPLNVDVHMETYAFNYAFADNFVVFNYWIRNRNAFDLDSVYVSLYADLVVRNTNLTAPFGSPFFNKGGLGYIDSLNLGYAYDYNGDGGAADTYGAMKFLGSTPYRSSTSYQSWTFSNSTDPVYFSPATDLDKYAKMATGLTRGQINGIAKPSNNMTMVTAGPYSHIAAGDSINVVFALMAAKMINWKAPGGPDVASNRMNLILASSWSQRTYNGEDQNGSGIQDTNEVWTGPIVNGVRTPKRYFLPAPPDAPHVKVVPGDKTVDIYWDRSSEASVDPISGAKDFEGYHIYGTNAGFDLTISQDVLASMNLLGDFDRSDDNIGYNTGFGNVRLPSPVQFLPDTSHYAYKFTVPGVLNGWQYAFAVTAYDSGDASIGLLSLESSKLQTVARVFPGTPAVASSKDPVGVYPNPYYAHAYWDGAVERQRKLYFRNLPAQAEVRIYSLAGDLVDSFTHEGVTYNGSDIQWMQTFADGTQQFAGGEHAWDLISKKDQAIATGLYLFTVKNTATGEIQRGKFLIIK